jgi:hypothetical protein
LSHYEEVLKEAKEKQEKLAVQYIPELYYILLDEEKLQPEDCRARIERDCLDLWSRATIRKYLPPEAVNPEKQMAGKIGAKAKKRKQKILVSTDGTTEVEESCPVIQMEQDSARTNLAEIDSVNQNEEESKSFHKELDKQLSSRTISPELLEANRIIAEKDRVIEGLTQENEELLKRDNPSSQGHIIDIQQQQTQIELTKKDALIKELKFRIDRLEEQLEVTKSNGRNENNSFSSTSNDEHDNPTIDFELSFPFEDVQNHMNSIYNENRGLVNIISFHGRLNLKTRKVVAVSIGNILKEDKDEDFANSSKDSKV